MSGWLPVDVEALRTDDHLRCWVNHGLGYDRAPKPK